MRSRLELWLALGLVLACAVQPSLGRLLVEYPFVISHDAGTGYLPEGGVVNDWARTQTVGLAGQLECGARGYDLRPLLLKDGRLIMHHGVVQVPHPLRQALGEVIRWSQGRSKPEDLVIVYINSCRAESGGDQACEQAVSALLLELGVAQVDRCEDLQRMTLDQAMRRSQLANGGHVLAIRGCVNENYLSNVECYLESAAASAGSTVADRIGAASHPLEHGRVLLQKLAAARAPSQLSDGSSFKDVAPGASHSPVEETLQSVAVCWSEAANSRVPWDRYWDYANATLRAIPPEGQVPKLWMLQAHWQVNAYSVVQGILHGSSIVRDSERSRFNLQVSQSIRAGTFRRFNMVELDHVCDSGEQVRRALLSVAGILGSQVT